MAGSAAGDCHDVETAGLVLPVSCVEEEIGGKPQPPLFHRADGFERAAVMAACPVAHFDEDHAALPVAHDQVHLPGAAVEIGPHQLEALAGEKAQGALFMEFAAAAG